MDRIFKYQYFSCSNGKKLKYLTEKLNEKYPKLRFGYFLSDKCYDLKYFKLEKTLDTCFLFVERDLCLMDIFENGCLNIDSFNIYLKYKEKDYSLSEYEKMLLL
jgi:hypothetical protein